MMIRKIITITILLASFIFANFNMNKEIYSLPDVKTIVPLTIKEWQGKNLNPGNAVFEFMEDYELLLRLYENKKTPETISVAVVLTDKREHIHDPEVCYRGQGIYVQSEENLSISPDINLKVLKGKRNEQPYNVIYWYSDLEKTYSERTFFMKNVVTSKFLGRPVKGYALIVLLVPGEIQESGFKDLATSLHSILITI